MPLQQQHVTSLNEREEKERKATEKVDRRPRPRGKKSAVVVDVVGGGGGGETRKKKEPFYRRSKKEREGELVE